MAQGVGIGVLLTKKRTEETSIQSQSKHGCQQSTFLLDYEYQGSMVLDSSCKSMKALRHLDKD